jgi:thiol-disulfide isomerase/thioredoxin
MDGHLPLALPPRSIPAAFAVRYFQLKFFSCRRIIVAIAVPGELMSANRLLLAMTLMSLLWSGCPMPGLCQSPAAGPSQPQSVPSNSAATAPATYLSDPRFTAAMADARKLTRSEQFTFAYDAYKKANKTAGGKCADCLRQMVVMALKAGQHRDALEATAQLSELATTPAERAAAESLQGQVILAAAGNKPKPDQLAAADKALKSAIADDPKDPTPYFVDGVVLTRMGDIDAARKQFQQCVACESPNDPNYLRTKHFAENPEDSIAKHAPAFTVTALDGSRFTLDAMGGRVVLIDFWATWCGPCVEELPQMKKIASDFAGEPLVIISISWDDNETKWKDFIAKNQMTWIQYRDADHKLGTLFEINAIPHYFTIDSDGVLTAEVLGSGNNVEGKLKKLIAKAKQVNARTASAAPTGVASTTAPVPNAQIN